MARSPRPPKPADPTRALRKLLRTMRDGEAADEAGVVAELTRLLDASPDALAPVDTLRVLAHAAEHGRLDVVELLLARGADPRLRTGERGDPCLASLLNHADLPRVIELAEKMVARGADPSERGEHASPLDRAVQAGLPLVEALLRLGADQAAARAALHVAVPLAARDLARAPIVERLLAHLDSVDATGPDGLSAVHILALRGTAELLAPALARSTDPAHPVASASLFNLDHCSPPAGGLVPQVLLAPGLTARDLAELVHDMHALAIHWYGDAGFAPKERALRRDQLAGVLASLGERGVPRGRPERGHLPAFVPELDALLLRLAAHVGADPDAVRRISAAVPIEGTGPWSYGSAVLERAHAALHRGALLEHREQSWLAHLVSGDHRRFLTERQAQKTPKPDPERYPEQARRPLELGVLVGGRGDALLLVWRHAEGVARVGVAAPDRFELLGDDPTDFFRRELRALGVTIDDIPAGPSLGPPGRGPQALRADHDTPPGPLEINRIGGLPIGVAEWPCHDDRPMHHVLTIDLALHPDYRPLRARALALFISSPTDHEAYAPHSPHTRVLLLSDADLARGETPLPPALVGAELLAPATLRLESAAGLTQRELYQRSFAGGDPIWLQGDESDGDYAVEEDDDEDDDARLEPPRSFVLQFDESLVPGINLGDAGIMYVFAETAWFQCH